MEKNITRKNIDFKTQQDGFTKEMIVTSALVSNNILNRDFDLEKAKKENGEALEAIGVQDGLQMMLGTQMLGINNLQKHVMMRANVSRCPDNYKYYVNTAIKLANAFTQQANLLNKLQGNSSQRMTVEHVHVHEGGQAIVGTVMHGGGPKEIPEEKNENDLIHRG